MKKLLVIMLFAFSLQIFGQGYQVTKGKNVTLSAEQIEMENKKIEEKIKTMPNYFADYDTTVHFVSLEELKKNHSKLPHGGFVIRTGKTGWDNENNHVIEYSLKLDSNPEFTASVIVAYSRAVYRMRKEGKIGAHTVFDVPPAYLLDMSAEEMRAHLL